MPELTVVHFGLLGLMLVIGVAVGWFVRADRCAKEKIAVNASWQDQLESQQSEHNRLAEQNKSLMEQISQYQASQKDYSNRAKELSDSLKEAFARRDDLQRQLKDMRSKAEIALAQRNKLNEELQNGPQGQTEALREKDDKIFQLSRELTSWQSRVPPLVERFQERDKDARALEEELEKAQMRLQAIEERVKSDNTRIEPVDADSLPDGGDASNEPIAMTSEHESAEIQDQIADEQFSAIFTGDEGSDNKDSNVQYEDAEHSRDADDDESGFHAVFDSDDVASAESVAANSIEDESFEVVTELGGDERDNLKMIKGIGPSIERTLNDLGVFRFHQIAEMSEYDIDRVAQQLKGFRSRIYREDWIGQARDLQYQKNNEHS